MGIRGTSSAQATSNTLTIPLNTVNVPGGGTTTPAVGDLAIIFSNSAYNDNALPSGWTTLYHLTGLVWNAFYAWKVLTTGDISGGATMGYVNTYDVNGGAVVFVGNPSIRESQFSVGNPGVASCTSAVTSSDIGIYWNSGRNSGTEPTVTPGAGSATVLEHNHLSDAAFKLYSQAMPGGAQTQTFSNQAQGEGYQIFVTAGAGTSGILIPYGLDGLGKFGQLKGGCNG